MNRVTAIIGVVVLLIVMMAANYFMTKSQNAVQINPRTGQPMDAEIDANNKAAQAQAVAAAAAKKPPVTTTLETVGKGAAGTPPPGEAEVGIPASAKKQITIGYTWDSASQVNPAALIDIANKLTDYAQKNGPAASLQIVCLDIPTAYLADPRDASVPLGVAVNGRPVAGCAGNPGEGPCTAAAALAATN